MPATLTRDALEEELRYVQSQVEEAQGDRWGTTLLMWQNRLADIKEQLTRLSAAAHAEASVALVFQGAPVIGERDIKLDFATVALDNYQKIVSLALASQSESNIESKGPVKSSEKSKLYIRDLVRGSMGFILEEKPSEQPSLMPTPLKIAVESTSRLLSALSSNQSGVYEEALVGTQGRMLAAVQRFSRVLSTSAATAKIYDDSNSINLDSDTISLLIGRLNDIEVKETPSTIVGVLLGILPESHQFELKISPSGEVMKGSITDEIADRYRMDTTIRDLTLRTVVAEILTVQTFRRGDLVKQQVFLEGITSGDAIRSLT
jgi:hypothetical protein